MPRKRPVLLVSGKLDVTEVDELITSVVGLGRSNSEKFGCVIDLAKVEFLSPAGMTGIVQAMSYLRIQGWTPHIVFPDSALVSGYLVRMGVKRACRDIGKCSGGPRGKLRYRTSNALVPLTAIRNTGDLDRLITLVADQVAHILEEQLGYQGEDVGNFVNVLSELSRNIVDHSGSTGYVAAQRYTRSDGRKFALISVTDLGAGLRATLSQRFDTQTWSDGDVIQRALLPRFSRHPDRGLGLSFVRQVSMDYQGSLHIRSGAARIYIRGSRISAHPVTHFPGTHLAISLAQRSS